MPRFDQPENVPDDSALLADAANSLFDEPDTEVDAPAEAVAEEVAESDDSDDDVDSFDPVAAMEEFDARTQLSDDPIPAAPVAEASVETPASDEQEAPAADELAAARAKIAELEAKLAEAPAPAEADAPLTDPIERNADGVYDFVGDDDPIDVFSTKEGANRLMTKVLHAATELAMRHSVPVMTAEAARVNAIHTFANEFYRANPELRAHGTKVSEVMRRLTAADPTLTPRDLFVKVAEASYAELGIVAKGRKQAAAAQAATLSGPGASRVGGSSAAGASLKQDLAEMMKQ